jgi:glyoxylase-like metal-dependent hydrolase (beta-lactamase superfamily II)
MRWASPDITFTQRMSLHWGGPEVILEHHPGPTPGAIWVIIPEAKVVYIGDMVVLDQPPFLAQADLPMWMEGLDTLLTSYSDYLVISGRGGPVSMDAIRFQLQFLSDVKNELEQLTAKAVSPDASEDLVKDLISRLALPDAWRDLYMQRLRYGVFQSYSRQYRLLSSSDQDDDQEDDKKGR